MEDTHLEEEVMRNWHEITADEFLFDRLHKEVWRNCSDIPIIYVII